MVELHKSSKQYNSSRKAKNLQELRRLESGHVGEPTPTKKDEAQIGLAFPIHFFALVSMLQLIHNYHLHVYTGAIIVTA